MARQMNQSKQQGRGKGGGKSQQQPRVGNSKGGGVSISLGGYSTNIMKAADDDAEKPDRTIIFEKTKMCKFHILGLCVKGTECRFAHDRDELNALPDLYRTKLCKTLINTGNCEDRNCQYAHNKEELVEPPKERAELDPERTVAVALSKALPKQGRGQSTQGGGNKGSNQGNQRQAVTNQGNEHYGRSAYGRGHQPNSSAMPNNQQAAYQMYQAQQRMMMMAMQASTQAAGMQGMAQPPYFAGFAPVMVACSDQGMPLPICGGLPMVANPAAFAAPQQMSQTVEEESQAFDEPAQIHPASLRSIKSSGSICDMGSHDGSHDGDTVPKTTMVTKNTFLEEVSEPAASSMRYVHSADGRLDMLASGMSTPSAGSPQYRPQEIHFDEPNAQFAFQMEVAETPVRRIASGTRLSTVQEMPQGAGSSVSRPLMPRPSSSGNMMNHWAQLPEDRPFDPQESPVRVDANAPSKISIGSLRSAGSGNNLAAMAPDNEDVHPALRSVGSGLNLAAMGDGGSDPASPQLRHVGSGNALASMATQDVYISQLSADSEFEGGDQQDSEFMLRGFGARERLSLDDALNESVRVKNTFLEFNDPRQNKGLRQVHTAAGRLDVMG